MLGRAAIAITAAAIGALIVLAFFNVRQSGSNASAVQAPPPAVVSLPSEPSSLQPVPTRPAVRLKRPQNNVWGLIEETRREAGDDTGRQSQLLKDRLTELPPRAILDFDRSRKNLDRRAYTWKLWGAAMVIEDGCSNDCFRDFRAYLISLGRGPYEQALRDPDSLASIVQDAEAGDWENADSLAGDAYSSVTGNDFPYEDSDLSGRPTGPRIDMSESSLRRRYPRLAARFRTH